MPFYQDTWLDGELVERGARDCAPRFDALAQFLVQYSRKFTVLDVGASRGYFGRRLVERFDCLPVMLEERDVLPSVPGCLCIRAKATGPLLREMFTSDHYDVVMLLSVLHHCERWQDVLYECVSGCDWLVVEYSTPEDIMCENYARAVDQFRAVEAMGGTVLGEFSSLTGPMGCRRMRVVQCGKRFMRSGAFYPPGKVPGPPKFVNSTFSSKTVNGAEWKHGMNLWSFVEAGGFHPSKYEIVKSLRRPERFHGDIRPWNFVLNADGAELIDWNDPKELTGPDADAFAMTVKYILGGHPDAVGGPRDT